MGIREIIRSTSLRDTIYMRDVTLCRPDDDDDDDDNTINIMTITTFGVHVIINYAHGNDRRILNTLCHFDVPAPY